MNENSSRIMGYFGKILILTGMVLVFGSIGVLLSNAIVQFIFQVDLSSVNISEIKKEDVAIISSLKLYQTLAGGIGMFLVPALLFPAAIKYPKNTLIMYQNRVYPKLVFLGVLAIIISVPAISWMYELNKSMRFPEILADFEAKIRLMEDQAEAITKIFVAADNLPMLLVNLFVVALVPAICEEFFFRGILLQYTRFVFDNSWIAILVSALVFSGFHGQFYGFLPRFALGVLLGYLFLNSGSIYIPIIAHFANNALAVLLIYFEKELAIFPVFASDYHFAWYWGILSTLACAAIAYYTRLSFIQAIYKIRK